MGTTPRLEIRQEGKSEKIYKDGKYEGEVTALDNGMFQWKNLLAPKINTPFTNGTANSRTAALVKLGYRPVGNAEPKKKGKERRGR
jgi:hypothetical protein